MDEYTEKVISLFTYLREFSVANQKLVTELDKQIWHKDLSEIPTYEDYVTFDYRDKSDEDDTEGDIDDVIISVKRPSLVPCPHKPDKSFERWLNFDWTNYKAKPSYIENGIVDEYGTIRSSQKYLDDNPAEVEAFRDDQKRSERYDRWIEKWQQWSDEQRDPGAVRDFFTELYNRYKELETDSETKEFLCGNAFIQIKNDGHVYHPILLKRLRLTFESETNTICIRDTTAKPEIYTLLLSAINATNTGDTLVDPAGVKALNKQVSDEEIHPLDRISVEELFKENINRLNPANQLATNADDSIDTVLNEQILITLKPTLFIRKRLNGAINSLEKIISNIRETGVVPQSLLDIVGKYAEEDPVEESELSPMQILAEIGGEDPDILLPLPANREQLEIARRISKESAVLVQGPPGTGKTHTIANLLGNFLAQGKSVLVTSDTRKALSVLKEKVPAELQALCVSLLDENNKDMERSVDGIVSFLGKHNSFDAKRHMDTAIVERNHLINELSRVRDSIYKIRFNDFQPVVYQGTNYSLIDIAKYVHENEDKLASLIPGNVAERDTLPLTYDELSSLYASNIELSKEEEEDIGGGLPNPEGFPSAYSLRENSSHLRAISKTIHDLAESIGFRIQNDFSLVNQYKTIHLGQTSYEDVRRLEVAATQYNYSDYPWKIKIIIDGKNGGGFSDAWKKLITLLQDAGKLSNKVYVEQLEHRVSLNNTADISFAIDAVNKMRSLLGESGKISGIQRLTNRKYLGYIDETISVNGSALQTTEQCEAVLHYLELITKREQLKSYWNSLIAANGGISFEQLQNDFPEQQAIKYIPEINKSLEWYSKDYPELLSIMYRAGLQGKEVFETNPLKTDEDNLKSILSTVQTRIPVLTALQNEILDYERESNVYAVGRQTILANNNGSPLMNELQKCYESLNVEEYNETLNTIQYLYNKESIIRQRTTLLQKLNTYAPEWAMAIRTRQGIHGEGNVPPDISSAWKWKQFDKTIKAFNEQSFDELQDKSTELSKRYRIATEEAAKWSAWYHLLQRVEHNKMLEQSLTGWRITMKRIGKGTGKRAAKFKKVAREQMKVCQKAVPVWIMTMNQVFDNLTPGDNKYDVVIVDEASQSNITALSIAYYGAKIIIVGDDKQVSPLAIGTEEAKINGLIDTYLSKDIPNRHLYTTRTSLYDIALTTFKPLMLHEHFRCVPEIIGFSNMLSYNNKILPLRDTNSTNLKPAIISYNAQGHRSDSRTLKTNVIEQNTVIALLKACFEMPEYENKTFGVISMLGDRQAEEIQARLSEDPEVLEKHKMLFGNSAQFQGDERDVIILTMVDSNEGEGKARILTEGVDEANKKRYNVAVSRARDQLWIIHSFNRALDLKEGDIRKVLLNYAESPMQQEQLANAETKSESPFEKDVAQRLTAKGYKIVQQWSVGSYRIDMVAVGQNGKVAIECDGERWHSGTEKIQQDMERQTILERIGWTFIRIRGSEYYADPEGTINDVIKDLNSYGIKPYTDSEQPETGSDLKEKVITKMAQYLEEFKSSSENNNTDADTETTDTDEAETGEYEVEINISVNENSEKNKSSLIEENSQNQKLETESKPDPEPEPEPTNHPEDDEDLLSAKRLYHDLLRNKLPCYLDQINKRIYVLYQPKTQLLAKRIINMYSRFIYEYRNPSSSPIENEMALVAKTKYDHNNDYVEITRDDLEYGDSHTDGKGIIDIQTQKTPDLPPHIIEEPLFILLQTRKKVYRDKETEIAMRRKATFQIAFPHFNLPMNKFSHFYVAINESGEAFEAKGVKAIVEKSVLTLEYTALKKVYIENSEFSRFESIYYSDNGFGRFSVFKDTNYVFKRGEPVRVTNDNWILQITAKTEDLFHQLSKEGSERQLRIPAEDAYDLSALRGINIILIKGNSSLYKCRAEVRVEKIPRFYLLTYKISNPEVKRLDDPFRYVYTSEKSYIELGVGIVSVMRKLTVIK